MARFYKLDNIKLIDLNALVKLLPGGSLRFLSTQTQYVSAILKSYAIMDEYGINTPRRIAHFIGQGLVETGFLRYKSENLNYSDKSLRKVFRSRVTEEDAKRLHRKPEAIANHVYGNRMGNVDPGDGWKYRGRGFFQLTGRNNYRRFGEIAGVDLEGNPEILEKDLTMSVRVAAAFFAHMNLGRYADQNNAAAVSRGINRGNPDSGSKANHEADRILWTQKVLELIENPDDVLSDTEITSGAISELRPGARGAAVVDLQEKLTQLGYSIGSVDGAYGQKTERAVVSFQFDNSLEKTGIADPETVAAIDAALEEETKPAGDIYREAQSDEEIRREVGARDGTGTGGALATAGGATGVAYETGALEEVVKAGKDIIDNVTDAATKADTEEPVSDPITEPATEMDEPVEDVPIADADDTVIDDVTEPSVSDDATTASTEVPAPTSPATQVEGDKDWLTIGFLGLVLVLGIFIFFRARARNRRSIEDYRYGGN